jgi:kexin
MPLFLFTLLALMQCKTSYAQPSPPTKAQCNSLDYTNCTSCIHLGCYWCKPYGQCESTTTTLGQCSTPAAWTASEGTCDSGSSSFSDPLYEAQEWVFDVLNVKDGKSLLAERISIYLHAHGANSSCNRARLHTVWDSFGLQGRGIKIQIVDDGVDATHTEFAGRFSEADSCEIYLPFDAEHGHGTGVAGIAAAGGNNGLCAVGVAPLASISSCRLRGPPGMTVDPTTAFNRATGKPAQ